MTWQEREEQAAADLGMTRDEYRMMLIRVWPWWIVGSGPRLRTRLINQQLGVCELCPLDAQKPLNWPHGEGDHVHHIRPKKEFLGDNLPILETIKKCWADENIRLVHTDCHKAHHKKAKEARHASRAHRRIWDTRCKP